MVEEVIGRISQQGNTAIVTFAKSSVSNVQDISRAAENIAAFVGSSRPKNVIFDFSNVKFFSSQVLGLLLETRAALGPVEGKVYISAINPQLHRVFKITNLDLVFKFFPDVDSALNAAGL
jgi:anti-sigma B factor antagonist